ncbi:MAG TPA: BamA/TamA family outer membrane protein [Candidatus Limnocylindria bacterium]|nr:BamA/TamA family outer membrane protein [Candidatus Limnocylindria bacterium]
MPRLRSAFLVTVVLALAQAAGAATLDYRGESLSRRQAESVLAPALRAPGDSLALARALERLIGRLQDLGHLDARAHGSWDTTGADPRLRLEVLEGRRYRLRLLVLETGSPADSLRFFDALELRAGGDFSPNALSAAVVTAVRRLADTGHPYAELGVSAVDWDSAGVRVRLNGSLGPAVTVTRARVEGLVATSPKVARRAVGRLEGGPYNRAAAEAGRERLAHLGLFRNVTLEGIEGEADWSRAQLVYRVQEPRYNRFEGAVGLQGEGQLIGLARLELDNLAGTGRAAALRWESRGPGLATFAARYAEPLLFGAPLRGEVALEQQVQDTIFTRTRWGARFGFALATRERLEAGYEQERVVQPEGPLERAELQTTVFGLERDARNDVFQPRRGTRVSLHASQTFKSEALRPSGRRTARASAVEGEAEWHRPLRGPTGIAVELRGAARFSSQRILPVFERYPVGGTASLRGHDEETFRADRYGLSRIEWRLFLGAGRQRLGLFWDHALLATRVPLAEGGDRLELVNADGIGFGLRLEAGGGLIGLDYGLEPGRAPLEGKIHLQLLTTF